RLRVFPDDGQHLIPDSIDYGAFFLLYIVLVVLLIAIQLLGLRVVVARQFGLGFLAHRRATCTHLALDSLDFLSLLLQGVLARGVFGFHRLEEFLPFLSGHDGRLHLNRGNLRWSRSGSLGVHGGGSPPHRRNECCNSIQTCAPSWPVLLFLGR